MPWLPDLANAAELARQHSRQVGYSDPAGQYLSALNSGHARDLEDIWSGEVVVHDPHAGEVRGHRHLRQFMSDSRKMLERRHARVERGATIVTPGRAVLELTVHLEVDGRMVDWPAAVVAESPDEESVVFRSYFHQGTVYGEGVVRPAILGAAQAHPGDVVGRFLAALDAADVATAVASFEPDGSFSPPTGTYRGTAELREYFQSTLAEGGISLENCAVTDDGVRCAVEYNCVRWDGQAVKPQAGIGIYERGPDDLLATVRVIDDVPRPGR
ncbi:nuclear transport factor 2 family protein [Actinoplanes sp. TBRC 11911]|uniref:nuclear transport factor 2 family protein n=1 Tax=Actinoplanes sp. TBRC 11911 TaxID=2729386 RepID=UPI00145F0B4C|nr:nuclear transport factor 2 family protein [Actinoplanes sp. TBRC 11911]NMO51772.1 nuclear transport factor 2 family protein [Actinoplanes sp. TBRC 11911]